VVAPALLAQVLMPVSQQSPFHFGFWCDRLAFAFAFAFAFGRSSADVVAVQLEARDQHVVIACRIVAEPCTFCVRLEIE
jgi:hypothetical protein